MPSRANGTRGNQKAPQGPGETKMARITIYVDFIGGQWEARYWHTDEQRYFRFSGITGNEAVFKAAKHSGYRRTDCRVVDHAG